jgi:4-carboxymuconolactone decarboxylase
MKKKTASNKVPNDQRFERGLKVRKAVLGAAHVARATAAQTEFDADFQRFVTETAWGAVWSRPGLDRRTRHLITIAILAALGREHELALHLRSIRNTGVSEADVREALLHVAAYAGIPAANAAVARAKEIFAAAAETKGRAHA